MANRQTYVIGALGVLVGMVVGAASDAADNTDYCALALAGKPLKADEQASSSGSTDSGATTEKKTEEPETNAIGGVLNNLFGN